MTRTYVKDGIEYCASNRRARYNPEYCANHGKPFTTSELAYLCSMYDAMDKRDIAMALGRTHGTVLTKAAELRKKGQFAMYKRMGKEGAKYGNQ